MQLLVMYKIDSRNFSLNIDEYPVIDLINEAKAQQARLSKINHIAVEVECDAELLGYCDYQNTSNALGTILNNAQRYCRNKVLISAYQEDGYLIFSIEDDGRGYPDLLIKADLGNPNSLDWISGNTGLGLYFVSAIAKLHKSKDKHGFVRIDNQSRIGGARFRLFLP
jgi:signal transduction histidine kinase